MPTAAELKAFWTEELSWTIGSCCRFSSQPNNT